MGEYALDIVGRGIMMGATRKHSINQGAQTSVELMSSRTAVSARCIGAFFEKVGCLLASYSGLEIVGIFFEGESLLSWFGLLTFSERLERG